MTDVLSAEQLARARTIEARLHALAEGADRCYRRLAAASDQAQADLALLISLLDQGRELHAELSELTGVVVTVVED